MNRDPKSSPEILARNAGNTAPVEGDVTLISRRAAIKSTLVAASSAAFAPNAVVEAAQTQPDPRRSSTWRYELNHSINLWDFPYPQRIPLTECLQLAKDAGF